MANCANGIVLSVEKSSSSSNFPYLLAKRFFASPGYNPFFHVILSGEKKN